MSSGSIATRSASAARLSGGLGLAAVLAIAETAAAQAPADAIRDAVLGEMSRLGKTRAGRVTGYGLGLTLGEREGRPEAWHTGGQERVSNVLYLSLDRGVAGGGRSVAILTNLERVQPEMLALARRVAGLWPLAAAPTASEAARRAVSRHF